MNEEKELKMLDEIICLGGAGKVSQSTATDALIKYMHIASERVSRAACEVSEGTIAVWVAVFEEFGRVLREKGTRSFPAMDIGGLADQLKESGKTDYIRNYIERYGEQEGADD